MTAPVGNRPVASPSTTTTRTTAAASDGRGIVDGLIAKDYELRKRTLGEGRADKLKADVTAEMDKFLAANPNATEAEIKAKFEEVNSKQAGYHITNKMRDDAFLKRLQRFMKESLADRWE